MKYSFIELGLHKDIYVTLITKYLDFLILGENKKAHCPFTAQMLKRKKFYYDVSIEVLTEKEFSLALNEMRNFLANISDRFAVACIVYRNNVNYSLETAEQVELYRQKFRIDFISSGLTIAWTHPKNELGTHTNKDKPSYPLWVSDMPMLMVRNLDPGDEPFMISPESKEAFKKGMEVVMRKGKKNSKSYLGRFFTKCPFSH